MGNGLADQGTPLAGTVVPCTAQPTTGAFYCPADLAGVACWGTNGAQILQSMHDAFPTIETQEVLGRDIGILLGIAGALKACYVGLLLWNQRRATQTPTPPRLDAAGRSGAEAEVARTRPHAAGADLSSVHVETELAESTRSSANPSARSPRSVASRRVEIR